jgi:hypothetical protein
MAISFLCHVLTLLQNLYLAVSHLSFNRLSIKEKRQRKVLKTPKSGAWNFLWDSLMSLNKALLQGMSNLSPEKFLSQVEKVPFRDLPLPHLMGSNSDIIENQYRKISHIDLAETSIFSDSSIPKNSSESWIGVQGYCLFDNCYPFQELANYCLSCLILPTSNAFVQRVFSQVTYVKNKQRNWAIKLLDSVIQIKNYLMRHKLCCKYFVIAPDAGKVLESETEAFMLTSHEDSELPLWLADLE